MNYRTFLITFSATAALSAMAQSVVAPAIPRDEKIEQQVEQTLARMTLDEKIGQICELTIDVIQDRNNTAGGFVIDEAKLDSVIGKYKVGSILNVPAGVAQDTAMWHNLIRRIQEKSLETMGIPCVYGVDQIHGTTYTLGGTFFPQGINMGATFNRGLTRRGAEISAYETRAASIPWTYAPVTDLGRDPRWPRMWENYGEDAYLNAEMGRESVLGFQGKNPNDIGSDNVAACMKHFMGYGVPVTGKDRTPSSISEQDMREKHFAPYLEMVRNGALSVMVNSASNNGIPLHANYELLTKWLKEDLNWDGLIVTDWADINNLYTRERIAKDKKDAIRIAINAGIDMAMEPYNWDFCPLLKELVEEGAVPMSRIDDAVRRVLRMKYRLNLFEQPWTNPADYPLFGSQEHAAEALAAAEESIVLLKNNNNLLPLKKGVKILVAGPNANSMRTLNGGWSYTWQGDRADEFTAQYNTIYEALADKFGKDNVTLAQGVTYPKGGNWWEDEATGIDKAVAVAANADVIVACVGENSYCETPGNLTDLTLSENQLNLVKALAATGKPVILVLNEGRPRIVAQIEPLAQAVIDVMLPGNYGGDALANLMAGDVNFSGKLPFTYPKEINSLFTYDHKVSENMAEVMEGAYNYDANVTVQWPFGHGLSYTDFKYSNLRADKSSFDKDDTLTFSVDVTNTGNVEGKESVLLFSSDLVASLVPDNRRLRNFEKISLKPGETRTVTMEVPASALAFVGADGKWVLEEGDFRISTGNQAVTVTCTDTYKWETPNK